MRITRWALKKNTATTTSHVENVRSIFYYSSASLTMAMNVICVSVGYTIFVYIHNSLSLLPNDVRVKFSLGSFFLQAKVLIENVRQVCILEKNERIITIYWTTVLFHPICVSKREGKESKKIHSWWIEAIFIKRHEKREEEEKKANNNNNTDYFQMTSMKISILLFPDCFHIARLKWAYRRRRKKLRHDGANWHLSM